MLQSISEGSNGVLLSRINGVGIFVDSQAGGNFSRASSIDYPIASDQSRDNTQGIVNRSLGLLNDHFGTSSDQNSNCFTVCTVLDYQHLLISSPELELFYSACLTKFLSSDLLESWDDPSTSGHGNEFDVDSSDPSDRWKFVLE